MIRRMAVRTPGRGRPSKGERKGYFTRIPVADATEIDADAEAADVSYSEYIAALVAIGLQHRDELPTEMKAKEVLPEAG
jgi:hypothetical protein